MPLHPPNTACVPPRLAVVEGKGYLKEAKDLAGDAKVKYEEMKGQADQLMEQGKKALGEAKDKAQGLSEEQAKQLLEKGNSLMEQAEAAKKKVNLMAGSSEQKIQELKAQVEEKFAAMVEEGQQVMDSASQAAEDVNGKMNALDPVSGQNPLDPPKPTLAPMVFDSRT